MDGNRFDRITRSLATGTSRRSLVHALAAGVMGGAAALLPGSGAARQQGRLADLDTEEQSVVLYEALAELADSHTGSCEELSDATQQLLLANADVLDTIRAEQDEWDQTRRLAHVQTYGDRLETATRTLHFARHRCGSRASTGPAATPATSLEHVRAFSKPMSLRQDSCDCGSNCPMGTGWCIYAWGACVSGAECECCWSSYCGSYSHCMTDCQANECCTGNDDCGSPDPPDGG
jgi:hypothetical protein